MHNITTCFWTISSSLQMKSITRHLENTLFSSSGEIKQNTLHSITEHTIQYHRTRYTVSQNYTVPQRAVWKGEGMTTNGLPWQNTKCYQHFGAIYCLILQVTIVNVTQCTLAHMYQMFYPVRWNTTLQKSQLLSCEMLHSRRQ